ncbi:MAG: HlyC/CorC family transporter [Lachnospiraceae bacterium]
MDTTDVIQIITLIVLLFLSAFFSSAETAFSTVNRIRMQALADEGNGPANKRAALVIKILDMRSRMLSSILIGNNIVNLTASALTTMIATALGGWAIGIATGLLTLLIILFGEIVPKTWAMLNNEKITLIYAPFVSFLCTILFPIIFLIDKLSNGFLRILRIDPNQKIVSITENELLSYVEAGHEEGVIESEEKEIIYNLFDFSDALAKDIMIPRVDIVEVDVNATYDEIREIFRQNMYSRLPVYEESPDNIIGVVNIKDFLFVEDTQNYILRENMREVYYTYEFKKVSDLLNEMREKTAAMTIVLNEYGAAEGMITMEDLLEEIVGEIRDEYDEDEEEHLREVGENEYLIDGSMKLDDINDQLGCHLESENYDSIGGIIIEQLDDRLPEKGESVTLDNGTQLFVEEFEQNRIQSVRVKFAIPETEDSDKNESVDETEEKDAETSENEE